MPVSQSEGACFIGTILQNPDVRLSAVWHRPVSAATGCLAHTLVLLSALHAEAPPPELHAPYMP